MNDCPRDGTPMEPHHFDGVTVDVCPSCGGAWLDRFELEKLDDAAETAGAELAALMERYRNPAIDLSPRLHSPKQPDVVMLRRFHSPAHQIEVDECPATGGIWLDGGELARMRELYPDQAARDAATEVLMDELMSDPGFQQLRGESEDARRRAERLSRLFRWMFPHRRSSEAA